MRKNGMMALAAMLAIVLGCVGFVSCGSSSDAETEAKLDGTWKSTEYESEDGMTMKMVETVTYDAANHKMETELAAYVTSPIHKKMFTVEYSGSWSASKDELLNEIDEKSVHFSFSKWIDRSDREEMENEIMQDMNSSAFMDGGKFVEIGDDYFVIEDEEDGTQYRYERVK